jgi:2-polyprenyl-6-methoxyphenol hydroxylase-like FAD-dependent oxidoreductase
VTKIIICGGGVIGLCAGTMLARDGHSVTVLEADGAAVPSSAGEAWESWDRPGVSQFRQPHNLFARFRMVSDEELPGLTDYLVRAGCIWVDYLDENSLPPTIADKVSRPCAAALRFVTGRRPVVERAMAQMAAAEPNLSIRRGVSPRELITGPSAIPGVPHIVGVRSTSGEDIRADLVVDAMGRRSPVRRWIVQAGGRSPIEETVNSNFTYYSQYFSGTRQPRRIGRPLSPMGNFSILTSHGDNSSWSVTLYTPAKNNVLRTLREPATFHRIVAACPMQAHWLDGKPLTPILPMAGVGDRYRRFIVDGQPVVTGLAVVGDAWACTNPSAGRGLSVGLVHAQVLRKAVRRHINDPAALATTYDAETERRVAPFYWNQIAADRARIAEMNALLDGTPTPDPDPVLSKFFALASQDADVFRTLVETMLCVAHLDEVLARPCVAAKMARFEGAVSPLPVPIDRTRLLGLLEG